MFVSKLAIAAKFPFQVQPAPGASQLDSPACPVVELRPKVTVAVMKPVFEATLEPSGTLTPAPSEAQLTVSFCGNPTEVLTIVKESALAPDTAKMTKATETAKTAPNLRILFPSPGPQGLCAPLPQTSPAHIQASYLYQSRGAMSML